MLRKLIECLKCWATKPKSESCDSPSGVKNECHLKVQVQQHSKIQYSDLYQKITQSWIASGISLSVIPAGKKLYSGQTSQDVDVFDHTYNARQYGVPGISPP